MKTYSVTYAGENRTVNQDCFLCEEGAVGSFSNLFIVADGMGGSKGGDFASRYCVDNVKEYISKSGEELSAISIIRGAVKFANDGLRKEKISMEEDISKCGTTIVLATVKDGVLYVANVGDSRLYVLQKEVLKQVTEDHSLVEEMIRKGHLDRTEALYHPDRHVITRALGSEPEVEADFFEVKVGEGDKILLCTDGLSNGMEEKAMEEIMNEDGELSEICEKLAGTAKFNGSKDDITAVIIEV